MKSVGAPNYRGRIAGGLSMSYFRCQRARSGTKLFLVLQAFGQIGWEERVGNVDGDMAVDFVAYHLPGEWGASRNEINTRGLDENRYFFFLPNCPQTSTFTPPGSMLEGGLPLFAVLAQGHLHIL